MRLYLLRHGEAEHTSATGKDFDRPLSVYGKKQVRKVKNHLNEKQNETSFRTYCSNATRTKETFQILSAGIQIKGSDFYDELYHANYEFLLEFLGRIDNTEKNVMLIGHNNGISDLASYLLDQRIGLPTAGFLIIDFKTINNWNELGRGTGEEMDRLFPIVD